MTAPVLEAPPAVPTLESVLAADRFVAPRWYTPSLYPANQGDVRWQWAEEWMAVLKGPLVSLGDKPAMVRFLLWQKWLIENIFEVRPDGLYRYRTGLAGMARQNGKSLFGSGLAGHALVAGNPGTEVYSAAGDRDQAKIIFGEVRHQMLRSPALAELVERKYLKVYRDAIEVPSSGNVYKALSADADLEQGLSPTLVLFDEVHVQPNEDLWEAMRFGMGARPNALILGITTAGDDPDSLLYRLYSYGLKIIQGEIQDESFGMWWWEPADPRCDLTDRTAWEQANPSLPSGLVLEEDMLQTAMQSRAEGFRQFKLNQFVFGGGTAWVNIDTFTATGDDTLELHDGDDVVVTFDGSESDDATSITVTRLNPDYPESFLYGLWERGDLDDEEWRVPRNEVDATVDELFRRFKVRRMACDTSYWQSEIQDWQDRYGGRVVIEWPVTDARAGPAVTEAYKRIKQGADYFRHQPDPRLTRHVRNARTKTLRGGNLHTIRKEKPKSPNKIDAAMTLCMGVDLWTRERKKRRKGVRGA